MASKNEKTSKTARVMNLLSKKSDTGASEEAAAAAVPPIVSSMAPDAAVSAQIKNALEDTLEGELGPAQPAVQEKPAPAPQRSPEPAPEPEPEPAPAPEPEPDEFEHYTPPVAPEAEQEYDLPYHAEPDDYRSVVDKLYANSIRIDSPFEVEIPDDNAHAIEGIDFHDIEARAAQDGIKIVTSGKVEKTKQQISASVVHKGHALFLSALLFFFVAVAEGAVVMGLMKTYRISIAYPCVLWGIGLVVLLVTGLAYANHFGEHSLRKSTPALINTIVLYVLSVIVTLIIALSVKISFSNPKSVACFVVIPIVYLFGIVVFGVSYYLQVRPKK